MSAPDFSQFSPEMQEKLRAIDFGLEVQAFLKTRVGAYLVDKAQEDVEKHTQALKAFDILGNPKGATSLQMEIKCAENVLYWLADAVNTGVDLTKQMLAEERQALSGGGTVSPEGDPTGS